MQHQSTEDGHEGLVSCAVAVGAVNTVRRKRKAEISLSLRSKVEQVRYEGCCEFGDSARHQLDGE